MLILGMPGAARMATQLAAQLDAEFSEIALHRFPDGESLTRIDAQLKGRCVVITANLRHPDEKTLPMVFAADAARELGASQVGLVAPYLAYMRQDHRFNPGEAITSRSYARLISSSFDFLVTVDPHLHRWRDLGEIYPIRTQAVASAPAIARWVRKHVKEPLLVGPDAESEQWVAEVAALVDAPFTVLTKTRTGDRNVRVKLAQKGPWPGRTPVLLDDIISTGETALAATRAVRAVGLAPPVCAAVHALFEADALWRLLEAGVAAVVTCDSVPHSTNAIALAPLIAKATRKIARL
jgi:ribose-phosphate pyrophosphokinase